MFTFMVHPQVPHKSSNSLLPVAFDLSLALLNIHVPVDILQPHRSSLLVSPVDLLSAFDKTMLVPVSTSTAFPLRTTDIAELETAPTTTDSKHCPER